MSLAPRLSLAALAVAALTPLVATAQPAPAPSPRPPSGPPPAAAPRLTWESPDPAAERTFTFQLVLLAASVEGPSGYENVPVNAQKALADVKDFLPYKSYELLDLAWLRSSRTAQAQLAGPEGKTLSAGIEFFSSSDEPDRIYIRRLVVVPVPELGELAQIQPSESARGLLRSVRPLLESSFGMQSGETIVVGTAKLDGPSKALIVLLSALP